MLMAANAQMPSATVNAKLARLRSTICEAILILTISERYIVPKLDAPSAMQAPMPLAQAEILVLG